MYSELIMMCNVIMTLYDAVGGEEGWEYQLQAFVSHIFWKNEDLEAEKKTSGWVYRASERSGVKLSTDRWKNPHMDQKLKKHKCSMTKTQHHFFWFQMFLPVFNYPAF